MAKIKTENPTVVRNDLGLAIAGTRITLYDVMDYIKDDWQPSAIKEWLNLTESQITNVIEYIENHREEVEAEYQAVLAYAEEVRQYWDERNRERIAEIRKMPPPPGQEKAWAKLQETKARLGLE